VKHVGWEACFIVVAVLAAIKMGMFSFMPPPQRAAQQKPHGHPLAGYGALFKSKQYLGYTLSHAFAMGGLITFIMSAPYVITAHTEGTVDDFAVMMIVLVACFAVAANIAAPIVRRFGANATIVAGSTLQVVGGLALLAVCAMMETPTVTTITLSMMPVNF
jgi:predicted MFS family arabinose efflux permease